MKFPQLLMSPLFAIALLGTPQGASANDSSSTFLQAWTQAWTTSDVEKMMAFYDTAKDTTAIESLGHVRRGPAEIRKMYRGAFEELIFDDVAITAITQGQNDSVAWATYRYKAQLRLKSDKSKYVLEVLGTFVMKQDNGSWKITLEHFSTIPDVPRVRPADGN
jgi:uncharacterized protein (TIGR02246 family)